MAVPAIARVTVAADGFILRQHTGTLYVKAAVVGQSPAKLPIFPGEAAASQVTADTRKIPMFIALPPVGKIL